MKSYIKLLSAALLVAGSTTQVSASEHDVLIRAIRATTGKTTGQITGMDYQAVVGKLPKGTELNNINSRIRALDDLVTVSNAAIDELEALGMTKPNATFLVDTLALKATKSVPPITAVAPSPGAIAIMLDLDSVFDTTTVISALPQFNRAALDYVVSTIANSTSDVEALFKNVVSGAAPSGVFAPHAGVISRVEILTNPQVALAKLIKAVYDAEIAGNAAIVDKTPMDAAALAEIDQALLANLFSKLK